MTVIIEALYIILCYHPAIFIFGLLVGIDILLLIGLYAKEMV